MKNTLILVVGIVIGLGLAALWSALWGSGPDQAQRVRNGAVESTESVRVSNGQVIETRRGESGKSDRQRGGGIEQVRINGRVIRTRQKPPDERAGGERPRSGERRGEQNLRRDYRKRHEKRRDKLPVDPGVAEQIMHVLESGAEAFGGATVPSSMTASR